MSHRNSSLCLLAALFAALLLTFCASARCPAQDKSPLPLDRQAVWSPDGKKIAFVSTRGQASENLTNIWIVNADGTALRQLTFRGVNDHPTWSPDGALIAFESDGKIWQVEPATGKFTMLMGGDRPWTAPDWHPRNAGKMACAYKTNASAESDIYIINPETALNRLSGRQVVREREGRDDNPRWSRNGDRIAFDGEVIDRLDQTSRWYLMTMRPDGTDLKTHCQVSPSNARVSWLRDGLSVLIDGGVVCELATGKMTSLYGEKLIEPDLSADGKQVVFSEVAPDVGQFIFTSKTDGSDKKQITKP